MSAAPCSRTSSTPTSCRPIIWELASGQECSFLKSQKDGGPFCRDSFERVVYEAPIYCYRTLGEIACYDKRDPYGPTSTRVR